MTTEAPEERVYRAVFDGVMHQRLAPGTKLPEAALCELFDTTRSVVRRVLQRLAHEHIVQLRPNRGAVVAVPTPDETRQVFEARRVLEAALLRLAVKNATSDDLAALRAQLQAEHRALHGAARADWVALAGRFHLRLAALARNGLLERHLLETVSRCSLIVALCQPPGNAACEHGEHAAIVDRLAVGDADGAVALMDAHLLALEQQVQRRRAGTAPDLRAMLGLEPAA